MPPEFSDAQLCPTRKWVVSGIRQAAGFFSPLARLLPAGTELYLEGSSLAPDVRVFLQHESIEPIHTFPRGTSYPKSDCYYLLLSEDVAQRLDSIAQRHAEPEVCDHLLAQRAGRVQCVWYDAFDADLLLAAELAEERVAAFCRALEARYSSETAG